VVKDSSVGPLAAHAALVGLGASDQEAEELVDSHPMLLEHSLERLHHHLQLIMTQSCCTLQQAVTRASAFPYLLSIQPCDLLYHLEKLKREGDGA
jgi:hypothetical protein